MESGCTFLKINHLKIVIILSLFTENFMSSKIVNLVKSKLSLLTTGHCSKVKLARNGINKIKKFVASLRHNMSKHKIVALNCLLFTCIVLYNDQFLVKTFFS